MKNINLKRIFQNPNIQGLLTLFFILIFIGLSIPSWSNILSKAGKQEAQETIQPSQPTLPISTASPSAAPTPTPIPIPLHSGRMIRVPILTYHYIGNNPNPQDRARDNLEVTPDKFEEQMKFLVENGYNVISLNTMYAILKGQAQLPSKPVIITFDDGYMDFYYNAFPILRRLNLHAVAFIPTGLMGSGYYMTWPQVKEIDSTGLVSFQAHSVSHPNLTTLGKEQLIYQLTESKKTLEAQLGKPVNFIAYPYGISNQRVWDAAREAGYLGAVGTWYGTTQSEGVIYDLPRVKVAGEANLTSFISKL